MIVTVFGGLDESPRHEKQFHVQLIILTLRTWIHFFW